jgi:hypothetical protein
MLVAPGALLIIHARLHVNALGICAFKTLAGFDCPACGITHSIMALLNGCIQAERGVRAEWRLVKP